MKKIWNELYIDGKKIYVWWGKTPPLYVQHLLKLKGVKHVQRV